MSFSPALRHRQKLLASRAAELAGKPGRGSRKAPGQTAPDMPEAGPVATAYQQQLAQLHEDLRALHNIQSLENKVAYKEKAIGKYLDWCQGAVAIDEGAAAPQDEIVVTVLVWALDIRNWQLALDLAAHCTAHGLTLPERYVRSIPCLIVSEIGDAALKEPGSVPHDVLTAAAAYVDPKFDMKDSYRARLHRALGESWARQAQDFDPTAETALAGGKPALVDAALGEFKRALTLDANVGVKKPIEQLEREAAKLAAAAIDEGKG